MKIIASSIFMILCIVLFFSTAHAITVRSTFECNADDASVTLYNYLKEPGLQENGFTRGIKTGSFNYLKRGDVSLKDNLLYYDGHIDPKDPQKDERNGNASMIHNMEVDFSGVNGISEFYAKGFFPSNRAVSAFKKIWYTDYSKYGYNNYILDDDPDNPQGIYRTDYINVIASASIGPTKETLGIPRDGDFDFKYTANVANGIFEAKEAFGWTNRTGARRTEWDQEAMIKGKIINVTNNLQVEGLFIPGAGGEDWLPCCFSGTKPLIEPKQLVLNTWPSSGVFATLAPAMLLPNRKCTPYRCYECNGSQCTEGIRAAVTNFTLPNSNTCRTGDCSGFPCIYTFGDIYGSTSQSLLNYTPNYISVESYYGIPDAEGIIIYKTIVRNIGTRELKNVELMDILPENMFFVNGDETPDISTTDDRKSQRLTWKLGTLLGAKSYADTGQSLEVNIMVNTNGSTNYEKNFVKAAAIVVDPDVTEPATDESYSLEEPAAPGIS